MMQWIGFFGTFYQTRFENYSLASNLVNEVGKISRNKRGAVESLVERNSVDIDY